MNKTVKEVKLGGNGGQIGLYADSKDLMLGVKYPIAEIAAPIADVLDKGIDFIEKIIPMDQKALAAALKISMRNGLTKAFSALLPGTETPEVASADQALDAGSQV